MSLISAGEESDPEKRRFVVFTDRLGSKQEIGEDLSRESSQPLRKVFRSLRGDGIGPADIARALAIPTRELDSLVFGLVLDAVPGSGPRPNDRAGRPDLRLVE